jgi:5-methylcytosine-specific restriction endonuclease McrBC GTP-binding regulatory subunit McrB
MNTWIKLHARMVSSLRNFGRTWLACKKKYKTLLVEYKNDKRSNEISGHERRECQYYEQMDMWNGQRASVVNQMPASAQEDDAQHTTEQNSPASATKDKKKKFQDKMEGFLEQIVSNSSNLIASFQATTDLLKNMDAHMATLVQKL